jgi:2-succinyl-6-hydroxy-2,4-cyclohexadiene-1-carboxylate synthase
MIVLLHGFAGDASSWDEVRAKLDPDTAVVCPRLIGDGVETFEEEVDRLAEVLRGISSLHVCGYSLGARLGLGLLVRHPSLFERATLIGVSPGLEIEDERTARLRADEAWIRMLEEEGIERFAQAWEAQPLFSSQSAEQKQRERARRLKQDPRELARAMRLVGLAAMPDLWPSLGSVALPIRLVAGERDEKFVGIARRMLSSLPHAELTVASGCGHNVVLENPDLIAELLRS